MKLAFIGVGVMGEAIVKGVLSTGLCSPEDIAASDTNRQRLDAVCSTYGIKATRSNIAAIRGCDVVVLAVKPQNLPELLPPLNGQIDKGQLILSIVAGATISTIVTGLGHDAIVRAMPNTPAQVGAGLCVWTASSAVTRGQKQKAKSILGALGSEIYVPDEKYIDMATAVSGSGPAYIYLVMEALIDAATGIGWDRDTAETLVRETTLGAALLAQDTGRSPAELRRMVTSPGGTTEAGIAQLDGIRDAFRRAVEAAYRRAQELGK